VRTIGLIGGTGPESTIEYYGRIIAAYREKEPQRRYPSIIINSIDASKLIALISARRYADVTDFLVPEIARLAAAGANFAAISANTPHVVFDEVSARATVPMISIVEATADVAKNLGLKKLGLLGTRTTMEFGFYPKVFSRYGLDVAIPSPSAREYVHDKYMGELFNGIIRDETRAKLESIVADLVKTERIDGIILGGTELSLIVRQASFGGVPVLDTTQIHVDRIVREALA
jgi:aspartate racemase